MFYGLVCCMFSHVQIFVTPWIVARQIPLSMGFPRQEYWSGLPFPTPGDLPDSEIELASLATPALAGRFFTTAPCMVLAFIFKSLTHFQLTFIHSAE